MNDALPAARDSKNCILERAYRNTPLTNVHKQRNRQHSGIRSIVERVFGVLKLHYGMGQARYLGLVRNIARFGLMYIAYNRKRGWRFNGIYRPFRIVVSESRQTG